MQCRAVRGGEAGLLEFLDIMKTETSSTPPSYPEAVLDVQVSKVHHVSAVHFCLSRVTIFMQWVLLYSGWH